MDVFNKIAKFILISLIGITIFLFFIDMGKIFITYSSNNYLAKNTSSYINTFSVDAQALAVASEGEQYVELDDVKENLSYFLRQHFENTGYSVTSENNGSLGEDQFKMVFSPNTHESVQSAWSSDVFVRAKFYGFDGTPSIPGEYGSKKGLIRVNIEHKVPAGMRTFMMNNGLPFRSVENPSTGEDYEGYIGFYSVESESAFTINIVK